MARDFVVTAKLGTPIIKDSAVIDTVYTYQIDYSPWAEDNNSINSVTWTVDAGSASISGETLSSDVASAQVTFSNEGRNLIKIKADTGTEVHIMYWNVSVEDPKTVIGFGDYT